MRHPPVLSDLELHLLGRIREEPRSGYAIRKTLDASPGAIYPALRRLAAAGLIEGKTEGTGARPRQVFHATAAGRRALRDALSRPTPDEMRHDPQGVAARLRFLEGTAAVAFLEEYGRISGECASALKGRSSLVENHDAALYTARARWAAAAVKRLRRG